MIGARIRLIIIGTLPFMAAYSGCLLIGGVLHAPWYAVYPAAFWCAGKSHDRAVAPFADLPYRPG